jgi:hypothetical protein
LRFIRLYLLTHRIPAAARVFKETVAESVDNHRFSPEVVTFSTWEILEQTLLQVSDHELVKFADELFGSLSNWPQAQAAVRFQQSRALFARFLVTDARFRLLDAEDLARTSLAAHILAKIYSEKLFFRHFHHDWRRWLEDALNAFLELSRDCVSGDSRRYFAGVFRSFIETNRKQFGPPISNLEEYWSEHPFEVATTIILRTATRFSVSTKPVAELRQWLRSNEPSPMFSQTIT